MIKSFRNLMPTSRSDFFECLNRSRQEMREIIELYIAALYSAADNYEYGS